MTGIKRVKREHSRHGSAMGPATLENNSKKPVTIQKRRGLRRLKPVRRNTSSKQVRPDKFSSYSTFQLMKMTVRMARATMVSFWSRHRVASRLIALFLLAIIVFALFVEFFETKQVADAYDISGDVSKLLDSPIAVYADKLTQDTKSGNYTFNGGYTPGGDVGGNSFAPKITAEFKNSPDNSVTVNDPINQVGITFKPSFNLKAPLKNLNRIIYPITGWPASKVFTAQGSGIKEDIIFRSMPKSDTATFDYEVGLPNGVEARIESDGSVGVYGVDSTLLGNVSASSESDKALLEKARKNGEKTQFLFSIPAPVVFEKQVKNVASVVKASYELKGSTLSLHIKGLKSAQYPLSIDPTIYVETAQKLMRGNNETNTDFDTNNELIQKSQTTGARIDSWQGNLGMNEGSWRQGAAAAGGYVYRTGGDSGVNTKPYIVDQESSVQSTDSTNFAMAMPDDRPAGDLYIALMCHDGTGTPGLPSGGGWTQLTDQDEFAAYWKVGTDQGGGNEAASYTWTITGGEQWYGVVIRVTNFDSSGIPDGTTGTSNSSGSPAFPAGTPNNGSSLAIRAVGVNNDVPDDTSWIPYGHTKIDSGTSSPSNLSSTTDCGFTAATMDTPPTSGVSTGSTTLPGSSMDDTYGAVTFFINPPAAPTTMPVVQSSTESLQNTNSTNFVMSMPASRPAGDLYIAVMCHDGSSGSNVTPPASGNWNEYADLQGHAAYWKIGEDKGGGNESASYTWTGPSENWAGVIIRVTGFDTSYTSGSPPVSSTRSEGSNTASPDFPAVTPDADNSLIIRAVGADNDEPSATAWVPTGHTKIASGGSTQANNDCAYLAASVDSPSASGVSQPQVTIGDSSISDDYGSTSIAIRPEPVAAAKALSTVNWAQFDPDTVRLTSPNPGTGTCDGWCTQSAYNLPSGRSGHSTIAYNGYLYVLGGVDTTGSRTSTVYISKLGANGEPSLWHPTDTDPDNWEYWYTDSGLNGGTAKTYFGAIAYNNRMYILGGDTDASPNGITTVEVADILPNGKLGSWTTTGMQALPAGAGTHMQGVQIYNDTLYVIGGFEGAITSSANLRNSIYYSRLNSDGTMNSWQSTKSFTTARASFGGTFSYIWGAYLYVSGGCTTVNGSGYCTDYATDTAVASLNADGSLDNWADLGIGNERVGYNLIGWQGGLYRIGGCVEVNSSNGDCTTSIADVDYGQINPAGEVSTVSITEPSGTSPCNGGSPYDCDIPPPGDDAGEGGQLLAMSVILNGYLYVIGGCIDYNCSGTTPASDDSDISGNVSYVSIGSDGSLQKPATCSGTSYGAWCVDSTNRINGTTGVAAAGVATFDNRIYIVGGLDTSADGSTEIYYNSTNSDGSLAGGWSNTTFGTAGISGEVAYTYAFARANPSSAGSNPGNLYVVGGCGDVGTGAGCASNNYLQTVYKCNIASAGSINGCTTIGQLQIDSTPGTGGADGLGIHSGTVYANYIFLIGGYSQAEADKDDVIYAKIDNSNNIVSATTGLSTGDWVESTHKLSVGRRRGWAFGYNGHIYSLGGYDAGGAGVGGVIPFIEWSKMNVSDGSIDAFVTSSVTINQRWGLTVAVSNAYAYVIGGCDAGGAPDSCTSFEPSIQTFQLYNNDSGSVADFTAQSDQTFTADANRWGASSTIYNGYIYVAGGCISATDCTDATSSTQYAPIDAADGSIGTWAAGGNLPADRAWGSLQAAGGTLYYVGGQDDTATNEQSTVYYTSGISSGNPTWNGTAATQGLPAARTKFGATVWNDRIYVVGGLDGSAAVSAVVYVSPKLSSGGNITTAWASSTNFNVARQLLATTAYANNIYLFGGFDSTNYLSDVQFASLGYKTGTISQSGTTVTGSGTTFTAAMVGSDILYADGSTATITAYSSGTSITVDASKSVTAGSRYLIDDGSVGTWTYTKSLPGPLAGAQALSVNGYMYLVGGRSAATTCRPKMVVAPISANTTINSGNNPTGVGEWFETNVRYAGGRYGMAVAYDDGKIYTMGGGCVSPTAPTYTTGTISQSGNTITGSGTSWNDNYLGATVTYSGYSGIITSVNSTTSLTMDTTGSVGGGTSYTISTTLHNESTVNSQPQVAIYSRLIDTDTDVFPNSWLMNGLDNSIGARWQVRYRSMNDTDGVATDCGSADMSTWGQETNYGNVTLGDVAPYIPKDGSGTDIDCARYFYFYVSIDASKTFGYPEDVDRGPTISDLSLFFTSDPSKRLRHGKTFTGGEQQPLDTPCRQTVDADCPLP